MPPTDPRRSGHYRRSIAILAAAVLSFVAAPFPALRAQGAPPREMRAVWLTTLSGLDWPASSLRNAPDDQRASLASKLDAIARMNLNTVFFQVRSRGNTMFPSTYEPWAAELTGVLGKDPGWDPLAFAVEECHKRGLELHAWVNVFKVWSGQSAPGAAVPRHLVHARPGWVTAYKGEEWIDPGIPEARAWLVEMLADLARRYDIDGLQLDYARYPESDFDDARTYRQYGRGRSKADWRRENIDAFVAALSARLAQVKPRLEIGAAPIGIYTSIPGARGWEGRNAVSQDSRRWLEEGWIDYVCPQVYWGLKERGSTIDFEALVRDWAGHSAGRTVVIGMAPYKEPVAKWLFEQIDVCRDGGADGEAYFRFEHIGDHNLFRDRYAGPAIAPAAPWRDDTRPNPPRNLALDRLRGRIHWDTPFPAADGETATRYVVYRTGIDAASTELCAVLPAGVTEWSDTRAGRTGDYAVTALDRLRNESAPASTAPLAMLTTPAPSMELPAPAISDGVATDDGVILVAYSVPKTSPTRIRLMDAQGAELMILVDEIREPGTYVIGIEKDKLPEAVRRIVFECGKVRSYKAFEG